MLFLNEMVYLNPILKCAEGGKYTHSQKHWQIKVSHDQPPLLTHPIPFLHWFLDQLVWFSRQSLVSHMQIVPEGASGEAACATWTMITMLLAWVALEGIIKSQSGPIPTMIRLYIGRLCGTALTINVSSFHCWCVRFMTDIWNTCRNIVLYKG